MFGMFLLRVRVDKNVVQVGDSCLVQVCSDNVVDQCLTCCWCVCESEWHNQILVVSVSGSEGCLPFFSFFHVYQVVYSFQVQLGKDCSLADPVSQFVHIWQQISVLDGNVVEFPVIHTKLKTSVFLWCK